MNTYRLACMYVCVNIGLDEFFRRKSRVWYFCMLYVFFMYVCMYACIYVCMYFCLYVSMYEYMFASLFLCIFFHVSVVCIIVQRLALLHAFLCCFIAFLCSCFVTFDGCSLSISPPTSFKRKYIYFHVFKVAVAGNDIKATGIQAIVDALKDCTTLQVLDLYCMCIVGFTQNMLIISFQYIMPQHMQP